MIKTLKKNQVTLFKILSVLLALLVWQIAAMRVGMDMLLASPVQVVIRLFTLLKEPDFLSTVLFSLWRITKGYLLAFAAGVLLGVAAGRFQVIGWFLWPYIVTIKTVPVASFIILCLLWLDFNQLTILISFLIAFPVIYSNVLQGFKSTDPQMKELASLYRIPFSRQLFYIYLPSVKPYLLSASAVSIGMAWKAGVAAEVIGLVDGSIGERLYQAKIYFQNADLLSWTLVIILVCAFSEKLFVWLLKAVCKGAEKL